VRTLRFSWQKKPYARLRIVGLFMVLTVLLYTFILWLSVAGSIRDLTQSRFAQAIELNKAALAYEFEVYADTLYSGRALFLVNDHVTHQEWETFVAAQNINQRYPAVASITYVAALSRSQATDYLKQLNAEKPSDVPEIRVYPDTGKKDLALLTYRAANAHNDSALGFDLLSDDRRAAMLSAARDTNSLRASEPLVIQSDLESGNKSVLITMPVYFSKAPSLATVEQRRANIQGYVVMALHIQDMLDFLFKNASYGNQLSASASTNGNILYSNVPENLQHSGLQKKVGLELAGQKWQVTYHAADTFGTARIGKRAPLAVLVAGILIALLLGLAFYYAIGLRLLRNQPQ
jgi:CHASE1-domain containing sensor protein